MITYLRLSNFRQHESTELTFDADSQVVLISGANGAGKSTIFEAVQFALFGEGRNGGRNLERLVRTGAELEGMEVELEFVLGDDTYRVRRRRDSKVSSAALYGNDEPLMEGSREVTAEVARILAMDARGFKVATYAQQKELNGLASMRPSDREKELARLLRLDVLTRAKADARKDFNEKRSILDSMQSTVDLDEVRALKETEEASAAATAEAIDAATAALAQIDADLAATAGVESRYAQATTAFAAAQATTNSLRDEVGRLEQELGEIVVPEEIALPDTPVEELEAGAKDVERQLLRAEELAKDREQAESLTRQIETCDGQIATFEDALAGDPADVDACSKAADDAAAKVADLDEQLTTLREQHAAVKQRLTHARSAAEQAEGLDAVCDACGQDVSDEHRAAQHARHAETAASEQKTLDQIETDGAALRKKLEAAQGEHRTAVDVLAAARDDASQRAQIAERLEDTTRRRAVYVGNRDRLNTDEVDLESLHAQRAEFAAALSQVSASRERAVVRGGVLEQEQSLKQKLADAVERFTTAESQMDSAAVDTDLEEEFKQRQDTLDRRHGEAELLAGLREELAATNERVAALGRDVTRGENEIARRSAVDNAAQVSLWSSKILDQIESEWSAQLKPSLIGAVGELLGRLSDGRFDSIDLDDNFNVFVRDEGTLRPLADLSGGETDLVALAMRLGLASVVADRHGAGGAGFLILDECFGSQDADRKESILTALRSLRGVYGQIFLISHVGGLDDAADAVIDVELDTEGIANATY